MKKIVMYTRLSNERDLANQTEERIESDEPTDESEQTVEEDK